MSGMMVVILALVIVAGVKTKAENAGFHIAEDTENSYEQQVAGQTDTTQDSGQEKWQEGVVAYQGKEYLYNTDIKTYLMMGVDINGPVQQSSDYTQGGQSDALFLLVVNNKTEQLQVISINRNTMADIELCDEEGIDMGPSVEWRQKSESPPWCRSSLRACTLRRTSRTAPVHFPQAAVCR